MAPSMKPSILLVPGSWHPPRCYAELVDTITALGYECICTPLATNGNDKTGLTWKDDVNGIRDAAVALFDQGKEVLIVAHSYGGIPACVATQNLGVSERAARGLRGGFRGIAFLAAFAIPVKGMDMLQTFGGVFPGWVNVGKPYSLTKVGLVDRRPCLSCLTNDVLEHANSRQ